MKNRFLITLSDLHGIKQYSFPNFYKQLLSLAIALVILLFLTLLVYIYHLQGVIDQEEMRYRKLANTKLELLNTIDKKSEEIKSLELQSLDDIDVYFEKISLADVLFSMIPNGSPVAFKSITSPYGKRTIFGKPDFHNGLDLEGYYGEPIYATADGFVLFAQEKGSYGNLIRLAHNFGFASHYGHLSKILVDKGDYVHKGDMIGRVGSSGRVTGAHLHYEIRFLDKTLDPEPFLWWSQNNYLGVFNLQEVAWDDILEKVEACKRAQ